MKAFARVQITVEVEAEGPWSPDTTIDQIHRQATESAEGALRRGLILHSGSSGKDTKTLGRIIGDPKVTIVMVEGAPSGSAGT